MQCKDIPDGPILRFLENYEGAWCHWFDPAEIEGKDSDAEDFRARSVVHAMPQGTPERLVLAKMCMLIRRGLVDGCTCGCRGDFEITEKGKAFLGRCSE